MRQRDSDTERDRDSDTERDNESDNESERECDGKNACVLHVSLSIHQSMCR